MRGQVVQKIERRGKLLYHHCSHAYAQRTTDFSSYHVENFLSLEILSWQRRRKASISFLEDMIMCITLRNFRTHM